MATTNFVAWALGVWGDGVWAADVWEEGEKPTPPDVLQSPFFTPVGGGPGSQITLRQMRLKRRRRREQQALALGLI